MINTLRKIRNLVQLKMIRLCRKTGFTSDLYYAFFSKEFRREHQSVLQGKYKHLIEVRGNKGNIYQLVRNIHRIEKGLLMVPRRPVFAIGYIEETIDLFSIELKNQRSDDSQLTWFHDVLTEYFSSCDSHDIVDKQYKRFSQLLDNYGHKKLKKTQKFPYVRETKNSSGISYEEFYQLNRQRRSTRWFLDKPVPRDLIDKAILAANQSPSACNRQPFEYIIVDDKKLLSQVVNVPMGTKGYADNLPVMIVVVGNLDAYFSERDRHLIYIDASLANMTLMLALETLGLSSCPINWPDIERKEIEMADLLGLEKHQRPVMCIGLGYPDPEKKVAYSEKKPINNLRKYNLG